MTIGEKIKYFRTRKGITQGKLAELSGIHPVTVRKYEINKTVPQQQQIDRLAKALGISSFALAGFDTNIRLETNGDFMGLLIMMLKSDILQINGTRGEDDLYNEEDVSFSVNPFIVNYFNISEKNKAIDADGILLTLKSKKLLQNILEWERINYRYEKSVAKYGDTTEQAVIDALEELKNDKEMIEMELQGSNESFNDKGGISVKILPDYTE